MNIFTAVALAATAMIVTASHVHSPNHQEAVEEKVRQTQIVYTAAVASGNSLSSSSDWFIGSSAMHASMSRGG